MMNLGFLANAGIASDPPDGSMSKSLAAEIAIVNAVGRSANDAPAALRVDAMATRFRVGNGFDFHPLEAGRRLVLGGVEIKHDKGLRGHSDADVAAHALANAILGAIGAGDLGRHFPDNDPKYKNADSIALLATCGNWQAIKDGVSATPT